MKLIRNSKPVRLLRFIYVLIVATACTGAAIAADEKAELLTGLGLSQFEFEGRSYHPRFVLVIDPTATITQVLHVFDEPPDLISEALKLIA